VNAVTSWLRGHRTLASVVTISLIVGVPLTFAAINPGYPVTDVQLSARDVWVTKSSAELAGRVNTQVGQLDSSLPTLSRDFDVLQDGESIFLEDQTANVLRQVDPNKVVTSGATTTDLPAGATVKFDGGVLAVESGAGKLWRVPVSDTGYLNFDYKTTPSVNIPKLGANAQISVERDGTVDVATTTGALYQLDATTGAVRSSSIPHLSKLQLSSVGTEPIILDPVHHLFIEANGSSHAAPGAVSIQQPGDESSYALLATSTGLVRVNLASGTAMTVAVAGASAVGTVAQPVHMGNCDNGVWSATATAVYACGSSTDVIKLGSDLAGDTFAFRVNQLSVALNDLNNGYSWLTGSATVINNWKTVLPQQQSAQTGKTDGKNVTFVVTPPKFDAVNQPPTAVDDVIGVRSPGTAPLPVLANDTDPDGDVLTVTSIGTTPTSFGTVQLGARGQSPQFTPAPGATGSQNVRYSISDGRGGIASATVKITIVPDTVDNAPKPNIAASEIVEQGQTVTYNVLDDWADPDGDAMQVTGATVASGDSVRFTPDGYITFRSVSDIGVKTVTYTVEDSSSAHKTAQGTLTVDVKAAGTTSPLAESDYASGFTGEPIVVSPLLNDRSPSGQALHLQTVKQVVGVGPAPILNVDQGTLQVNENQAGSYEFEYTETAGTGTKFTNAFIRVDVANRPSGHVPPIAVSDTAYLTYPGSVTVPVLNNDVSPEGLVLGVQSISAPTLSGFTAQLQSNTSIKITATGASAGDKPVVVNYTVSDGTSTASASVTVVAVSALVNHQAPITTDDSVTVRAGEVATVSVLNNDVDPDGAAMSVAQKLVQGPTAGLAFVTGNDVRYQAPSAPGQYAAVYSVVDTGSESSTGRVLFTVTPSTPKGNRPPAPEPVISRVFAGGTVRVQIPLAGIDPDGDTALLQSISQNPQLGKVTNATSTYFDYQAAKGALGTDVFNYEVTDPYGATATATVSIGVIPRAGLMLPTAVDDSAALKPGTRATVNVLANDSDPNGYAISVVPGSLKNLGTKSISASIVGGTSVVLHAGSAVGDYSVRYSISDGHAKAVTAVIHVAVSKTAVDLPPVAIDHILQLKDVASGKPVKVDAREGASDPSGVVSALGVTLAGTRARSARLSTGRVSVTPGKKALTIGYTLTDPLTHLTSTAFILVPPIPAPGWNLAPFIRKDLKQQIVQIGAPTKFTLAKIVTAPSGKVPVKIINRGLLKATHGSVKYTDAGDFTFTPANGYAGPASITFDVSDAAHPAHTAILTLPVTIGDPDGRDLKPTFTTIQARAPQKTTTAINLINATGNSKYVTYSATGGTSAVKGTTSGAQQGTLNVTVPVDAKVGSTVVFHVTLTTSAPSNYKVEGDVFVKIVSTLAPLAQAITDSAHIKRGVTTTIDALANDVNPTPDKPLRIVKVTIDNAGVGAAPTTNGSTVTFTPGPSFIGDVSLHYTIEDATGDANRDVTGVILVTVWDAPDQPAAPIIFGAGNAAVTVIFNTPPSDNGTAVESYTLRSSPATTSPHCTAGVYCNFNGLTNGTSYVFYVSATNQVGVSVESSASAPATPYGQPSIPNNATLSASGSAPATLNMTWAPPSDTGGGDITYHWVLSSGQSGDTTSTSASIGGMSASNYNFSVYAKNPSGQGPQTVSNGVTVSLPAPVMTISQPNSDHWVHLVIAGFPVNTTYSIACWVTPGPDGQNGHSIGSFNVTTDGSGGGTFDNPATCTMTGGGYGNLRSAVVWSNTILLN
jgi:hypothetical protein